MDNYYSFKLLKKELIIGTLFIGLIIACGNTPTAVSNSSQGISPTVDLQKSQQIDGKPTDSSTLIPQESLDSFSFSGESGVVFDYKAIPLGEEIILEEDGQKVSLMITKVLSGIQAEQIAFVRVPEEMKEIVIQLRISYIEGPSSPRMQFFSSEMFNLITNGDANPGRSDWQYTPSPRLSDVKLLPGESSLCYLVYQAYSDDIQPLLLLEWHGEEFFFNTTHYDILPIDPVESIQLTNPENTEIDPIQLGKPAYIEYNEVTYQVTVEKIERGFNAWKKIQDLFSINDEAPEGKEYILPFVSVKSINSPTKDVSSVSVLSFSSQSKGNPIPNPLNWFCPIPCFQKAQLYPGGKASGWIPLLVHNDDIKPLLVFNNQYFFSLSKDPSTSDEEILYPNAISYANRDKISQFLSVTQSGPVYSIAFSPDSRLILTAGDDRLVHVWDISDGSEIMTLEGHTGRITSIDFSPDSNYLSTTSAAGEVYIWDCTTWEIAQELETKGKVIFTRFLDDNKLMTVNDQRSIQIWNLNSGLVEQEEKVPTHMNSSCGGAKVISFDADEKVSILGASLSCGYSVIWERGKAEIIFANYNYQNEIPNGTKPSTSKIRISPSGKMASYGMVYYRNRRLMLMDIIDVTNAKVVASVNPLDLDHTAAAIAINNDFFFAGVGKILYGWWPEAYSWSDANLLSLTGNLSKITSIEFSADGAIMASGDYKGTTILWKNK